MKLAPGMVLAGRYEIIERIGSGGMAIVYRVRDKKLDRYAALKVMREEYMSDDEFLARFNIEARAAAGLSNPNIVTIYDVGQEDSIRFIVMEYVEGITLKDLIRRRAPFDSDEILGVAIQIASALQLAHQNKIIHRDIKPQNILVTAHGVVKVTDFGIARAATTGTLTTGKNTLGSVHYSSPEQARGGYVDVKSDIYSLGIVMYEMATGVLPFNGETPVAVALKHINEPLPGIKERNSRISDSLIKIITKATEKSSSKRYQSIEEMSNELKRALTNSAGEHISRDSVDGSPTVKLTEEDVEAIKRDARSVFFDDDEGEADEASYSEDAGYEYDDYDEEYVDDYDDEYEYEDDPADKSAERKTVAAAILTGVAIIALLSSIVWHFYNKSRPLPVQVPSLIGKTMSEAEAITKESGIIVEKKEEVYSDDYEPGLIILQDITGPAPIYKGEKIMVTVSLGTDKIKIPDLTNKVIKDVEKIMEGYKGDNNLSWHDEYEFSDDIPQNVSIKQVPEKDELVEKGSIITVFFSLGPQLVQTKVPNIAGKTEAEAKTMLQAAGLTVARTERAYSSSVREGLVISQSISANSVVNKGTIISFTISNGKAPVAATPVPTPSATPEPTPEPEPTPTPVPVTTIKELPLDLRLYLQEGQTQVHVRIYRITANSTDIFLNKPIDVKMFPTSLRDIGSGIVEYQIYIVDENDNARHVANQVINFDE